MRTLVLGFCLLISNLGQAQTLKDLVSIEGVRSNQLLGYGLVVGLNGTGDSASSAPFTAQSFNNLLNNFGIKLPDNTTNMQLKNIAAVAVSADLPPFAKLGQNLDVTVASIGNAKSLRGGTLLLTALKGIDGQIYALAQGNLLVSGIEADAKNGNRLSVNISSAGRIPNGATIENTVSNSFANSNVIRLNLHRASFSTAQNIAALINKKIGANKANAVDAASVEVKAPIAAEKKVALIAELENLPINQATEAAKVIINARSGTVIINQSVRVSEAAVSHGNLSVSIGKNKHLQYSRKGVQLNEQTQIKISEQNKEPLQFGGDADLDEIVQAIKQLGASPNDLIAILQALKEAGSLQAELVVI